MKKIIFHVPGLFHLQVMGPTEGARLAIKVTLANGTVISGAASPVDTFLRRWPVEGAMVEWAESEDDFVARIAAKDVPADATDVQIVDESAIPTDRTFRNAWKAGNGRVVHDMDKAREIQKDRLRLLRAPLFEPLERAQRTALANGDGAEAKAIEAQLQELRDVTDDPAITGAADVDALKTAIPSALNG